MPFGLQRGITGKLQVNHNAEKEPAPSMLFSRVRDWVSLKWVVVSLGITCSLNNETRNHSLMLCYVIV